MDEKIPNQNSDQKFIKSLTKLAAKSEHLS